MDKRQSHPIEPNERRRSRQPLNPGLESVKDAIGSIVKLLRVGMFILIMAFCFTGVRHLEQYENGVLLRFGEVKKDIKSEPGLVFALPYPIDELIKVPVKRTQTLESTSFWYELSDAERKTGGPEKIPQTLKPGVDGYLITADRNIIHARCIVKYRIINPIGYMFQSANVQTLIRVCLDNATIKVASKITIGQALENKNKFSQDVTSLLVKRLSTMNAGIEIDPVDIRLSWPRQLAGSINEVVKTKQNYEQKIASAKVYERSREDSAESHAYKIKSEADTWATRKISRAKSDAITFKKMYPLFKKNPNVIKRTLYQDRMKKIMANIDEVFIIEQTDNREIRINLERKEVTEKDGDKS